MHNTPVAKQHLNILVEGETHQALREYAHAKGQSMGSVVRSAIQAYLKNKTDNPKSEKGSK